MIHKRLFLSCAAAIGLAVSSQGASANQSVHQFKHIVVIYQENHSFDNLYGLWGDVWGEPVNGLSQADLAHTTQVRQDNVTAYLCLKQIDVNLASLPVTCTDSTGTVITSDFLNKPFKIDDFIAPDDKTCPAGSVFAPNGVLKNSAGALPGGCTRDIVHRYYSEQYQINQGKQNRYVTGSDAAGLVMGYYDTKTLPIYKYLHTHGSPQYVIADSFFQGAFGGSFLNHQWLVAGATPVFANALQDGSANDLHSILDSNGMATSTPLYTPTTTPPTAVKDLALTSKCSTLPAGSTAACGDYAINTIQPFSQPFSPGTIDAKRLPLLKNPTIGDRLSAANVDWAWYSGGWSNAAGNVGEPGWTNGNGPTCSDPNAKSTATYPNCPDNLFQFHHQAFNYFENFKPGTAARAAHLRDEVEFIAAANQGNLKPVSFVKALGSENEHPGYASESDGSDHLVDLIKAIVEGPNGHDTLIIVTYDEFGGAWDHVPPPPYNRPAPKKNQQAAPHDQWGPGTRVPALLVSQKFQKSGVDHTDHDTTSILKLIEERFGLEPLGTRDANAISLQTALEPAGVHN